MTKAETIRVQGNGKAREIAGGHQVRARPESLEREPGEGAGETKRVNPEQAEEEAGK